MGFRFRKTIKLLPGIRLNLSKSGISTSIGKPGATINIGERGLKATVGIPGAGVSYSENMPRRAPMPLQAPTAESINTSKRSAAWGIVWLAVIGLVIYAGIQLLAMV